MRWRCPRASNEPLPLPPSHRVGIVCAFVTNQHVHEQTGPSVEAVPETLLSLQGLVSDVPQVSTGNPSLSCTPMSTRPRQDRAPEGSWEGWGRSGSGAVR